MATHRKIVKSTKEVIAAFGGTLECARRWDVTKQAVSNWRKDGIPTGYHCRMEHSLEASGYVVDVSKLGWI